MTRLVHSMSYLFVFAVGGFLLAGCESGSTSDPVEVSGSPPPSAGDHEEHEEHEGPHHGHIIELGRSHEYHAELVENEEARSVTIYILDKDLKELPVEQESISLSLTAEGETKSFELKAADPTDGKTSRFESADENLFATLHDHEEVDAKLRVTIGGKPYTGDLHHHGHGHDGHGHDDHKGHSHDHDR